jgi:hypothetical protein
VIVALAIISASLFAIFIMWTLIILISMAAADTGYVGKHRVRDTRSSRRRRSTAGRSGPPVKRPAPRPNDQRRVNRPVATQKGTASHPRPLPAMRHY